MAVAVHIRRRSGRRQRHHAMSEINVTPMVDVMLVLLVIFMVAAPLLTVGVQVDLPQTKAAVLSGQDEPLSISIDAAGKVYVQNTEIGIEELAPRLAAITGNNPDVRIFVRGDQTIHYGRVMEVMGTVNAAGFRKVALVTGQPKPEPAADRRKRTAR